MIGFEKSKWKWWILIPSIALLLYFLLSSNGKLFDDPTSTILEDKNGVLLAAKIADDGQWRFPKSDTLPNKFIKAITYFEDQYFFYHPGVNPVSIFRAFRQNISAGKVVSGGSTISMQTIRLSRKGKSRTLLEKLIEITLSLQMEVNYSKNEILNLYASHAPFGGNVVGLDAAAWRYYGRSPQQLSWGEITTLAVLPNAPSLIYPGKNQEKLKAKRDHLLDKLFIHGQIDQFTCELAKDEPLPQKPHAIPRITPHLLTRVVKEGNKGKRIITTIDFVLQENVNRVVKNYHGVLSQNEIHNMAVLILDVEDGTVLAYTGNSDCPEEGSGREVDVVMAPRSTGSILKPFLYNFMLQDGAILPKSLIPDIPTHIAGYKPKNFDKKYDGAVHANDALARSLNIPAVRMLQSYGLEKFYHHLQNLDISTINKEADHYGLSIILGGAEATLWELTNEYMKMAQTLNGANVKNAVYNIGDKLQSEESPYDIASLWWTFEALTSLNRPWQETGWQDFQSAKKIAWKTGTSFGHRDAWAIGLTPKHVVGIWTGNADGEGRPGLTGLGVAAPIMFKLFKHLEYEEWFEKPEWDMIKVEVCKESGSLSSTSCESVSILLVPKNAQRSETCKYHKIVHLDAGEDFRVSSNCYPVASMKSKSWFVLPPVQELYYKKKNPFYKELPSFKFGCDENEIQNMAVIYPKNESKIFVPRELDGNLGKAVFEIAHRESDSVIYWHLDEEFLGSTTNIHRMEVAPTPGNYQMTLVDERGEMLSWKFEVLEK